MYHILKKTLQPFLKIKLDLEKNDIFRWTDLSDKKTQAMLSMEN